MIDGDDPSDEGLHWDWGALVVPQLFAPVALTAYLVSFTVAYIVVIRRKYSEQGHRS